MRENYGVDGAVLETHLALGVVVAWREAGRVFAIFVDAEVFVPVQGRERGWRWRFDGGTIFVRGRLVAGRYVVCLCAVGGCLDCVID